MNNSPERIYCKRLIMEAIEETIDELLSEKKRISENEAHTILSKIEKGIENGNALSEAKKKGKKSASKVKTTSKKKSSKKEKKEKEDKELKVMRKQVLSLLNQDKVDMAAVAREVYPKMNDDARRSYVSRQSRGKEPIANGKVSAYYNALRSTTKPRKNS